MAYSFDDNEGSKSDTRKNSNTTKFNGGIDGKSEKWTKKRESTSFNAGQGNRATRNQGTGVEGVKNTLPTDLVDTSKMNPDEKLKYFNMLNLMTTKPESNSEVTPRHSNRPVRKSVVQNRK